MKKAYRVIIAVLLIISLFFVSGCYKNYTYEDLEDLQDEITRKLVALDELCDCPTFISCAISSDEKHGQIVEVTLYEFSPQKDTVIEWLKRKGGSKIQIEFEDTFPSEY